ncbi:VgrG-related protein [Streptomyces sp. NPDC092307]|uniref:VgrG-related protein n=1 Tax=Streptomyces sp. NPDC092307 TaxID=3366013 RepID=UPI0038144A11
MSENPRSYLLEVAFTTKLTPFWLSQLERTSVDTDVLLPALCSLEFRDQDHTLLTDTNIKLGSPVSVSVATAEQQSAVKLFTGEVTAVESEVDDTGTYTVIRAMDYAHRMHREQRVESYHNQSIDDIVKTLLARSGLIPGVSQAPAKRYPYLGQMHQTDWQFLRQLADASGTEIHVDGRKLSLRKPARARDAPAPGTATVTSPYVLKYGANLLGLSTRVTSAGQVSNVEVRGWDPQTKLPVAKKVSTARTDRYDIGITPGDAATAFGKVPVARAATGSISHRDGDDLAAGIAEDLTSHLVDMEAMAVGTPQLKAGDAVTLTNTGRLFSGRYTSAAVRHLFDRDHGYRTWLQVGTPRAREWREPGGAVPIPGQNIGLATAIVDAVDEPGPQKKGSVRLRLPWLDANYLTDWVRTVQFGGEDGGGVISPSIGDEVLIGFEHGRLDRPYVLGGLYSGPDKPSTHDTQLIDLDGKHVNRRSLSSRRGDRIELLDDNDPGGKKGVRLITGGPALTPGGLPEVYLDRGTETITVAAGGRTLKIDNGGIEITHAVGGPGITLGADSITLSVGESELTMTATAITLKSPLVDINPSP